MSRTLGIAVLVGVGLSEVFGVVAWVAILAAVVTALLVDHFLTISREYTLAKEKRQAYDVAVEHWNGEHDE